MNWAPCLAASWARSSCFWIIDSLSPVQLAWTSAPRTVRAICASPRWGRVGVADGAYTAQARAGLLSPGNGLGRRRHVPLGELAAAALVVEAADEDVGELAVDGRSVVGQVAGPAVGDAGVAVDGEDLVVGLPGPGLRRDRSARRRRPPVAPTTASSNGSKA